jgi:ribosomal protein S18 acetylase RimI-like enzyme
VRQIYRGVSRRAFCFMVVANNNPASLRAFRKAGFRVESAVDQPPGAKAHVCYDLVLSREDVGFSSPLPPR